MATLGKVTTTAHEAAKPELWKQKLLWVAWEHSGHLWALNFPGKLS